MNNPDEVMHAVLPAALEVLSAWSIAENVPEPLRGLAQVIFGLSSLSGILLDELAGATGRSRGEVLHAVHLRYLDPRAGPPC
ncbi:MAG TPA: hypothetical protein VE645_12335 [Pseudonocardiaceae bacterium]|nr:hypothetical protein [Pseudonocardiaceae bacterium]